MAASVTPVGEVLTAAEAAELTSAASLDSSTLLDTRAAAQLLGVKPRWLELDRFGPKRVPFIRLSPRTIRYRRSDLEAFLASHLVPGLAGGAP